MPEFNLEAFIEKYRRVRDAKAALKARHEEELRPFNEALANAEARMLQHLDEQHVESARTAAGTVYKRTERSASVADWDKVLEHVREHEAWHLLNRSVSKTAAWTAAEEGDPVPGVELSSYVTVGIRKPERRD